MCVMDQPSILDTRASSGSNTCCCCCSVFKGDGGFRLLCDLGTIVSSPSESDISVCMEDVDTAVLREDEPLSSMRLLLLMLPR